MLSKNLYTKCGFIVVNVIAVISWMLIYFNNLFRCLQNKTYEESRYILFVFLILSVLLGCTIQMEKHRNIASVVANVLLGYGIYAIISYIDIYKKQIIIWAIVLSTLLIIDAFIIIFSNGVGALKRIIKKIVFNTYMMISYGVGLVVISITIGFLIGSSPFKAIDVSPTVQRVTIDEKENELAMFKVEQWRQLDFYKKMDLLQMLANIERSELAIKSELNVQAVNMNSDFQRGSYNNTNRTIKINIESVLYSSPKSLINTICHEARHAAQHCFLEIYNNQLSGSQKKSPFFEKARTFKKELNNPKHPSTDGIMDEKYINYYTQQTEVDARAYSKYKTGYYLEIINKREEQ